MLKESENVRTVERALTILSILASQRSGLGVSEIGARVDLHKATVYRLLSTMAAKGFIQQDPRSNRYRLAPKVLELAAGFLEQTDLTGLALPSMRALRDQINETITLYIRDGHERICLQRVESLQGIRRVITPGQRLALTRGASGKVLLAYLAGPERETVLAACRESDPSVSGWASFLLELESIQQKGVAVSIGEREAGAAAVAAPVIGPEGQVVAALSISGPETRFTPTTIAWLSDAVVRCAKEISHKLQIVGG